LLWIGGYLHFVANLPTEVLEPDRETDGIVVLTGSPNRLFEGLDLLRAGRGKRLLFSGVDRTNTREALKQALNENSQVFDCCVDLGWEARDTVGNAAEIARWARENGYKSLRVVTAHHHMPRSLVEIRRALPEVELVAHPVFPRREVPLPLPQRLMGWLQTVGEFGKYFVSLLRAGEDMNSSAIRDATGRVAA
jgi:uncharacterized SAM-binding protein YcdF (DUF218 family)